MRSAGGCQDLTSYQGQAVCPTCCATWKSQGKCAGSGLTVLGGGNVKNIVCPKTCGTCIPGGGLPSPTPTPKPTPKPTAISGYTVTPNSDHGGDDIQCPVSSSAQAVANMCNQDGNCKAFNFFYRDGQWYGCAKRVASPISPSGITNMCFYTKTTPPTVTGYTSKANWDYYDSATGGAADILGGGGDGTANAAGMTKAQFQCVFRGDKDPYGGINTDAMIEKHWGFFVKAAAAMNLVFGNPSEASIFFGNVKHEYGGFLDDMTEYCYRATKTNKCPSYDKCPGSTSNNYFGRGPLQLTHCPNYKGMLPYMGGADIVKNPELLADNTQDLGWRASIGFWLKSDFNCQ
ncbi:hypothetical protein TSOC_009028 [Tetrabaena socialis]|uniref:chitinase n=1 Tax=Tetrabaena socialis TaxID=47790 RepID=A0A2J7ZX45_9CHLO|nr:hypothetical protein TSOC_009028 [Tetrabaena socialis]|eukprot:PNH04832.1 hypothetical protein TSOC_009028 [Tetrabaena socialis]